MKTYVPYKKGYLEVSDRHKLYYELCGNPKGKPVLFVHGGPGAGFDEKDKQFFDPTVWNILLFDQRGAGRSKPFASLQNNTTQKLVEDIKVFLNFVEIEKVFLFGGSWGSTLSLVYAIHHPETVTGMLLRGIWLATKEDKEYYVGGGIKYFLPEAWKRFISLVPKEKREAADSYYLTQMQSRDNAIREKYIYEWAYYELSILRMRTNPKQIKEDLKDFSYHSLAPLEAFYVTNNCFLPDNFILKNAYKLINIPVTIVHGRYDFICPPANAYLLHKALKHSQLTFTTAGHSSTDEETKKVLIDQMKHFSKIA